MIICLGWTLSASWADEFKVQRKHHLLHFTVTVYIRGCVWPTDDSSHDYRPVQRTFWETLFHGFYQPSVSHCHENHPGSVLVLVRDNYALRVVYCKLYSEGLARTQKERELSVHSFGFESETILPMQWVRVVAMEKFTAVRCTKKIGMSRV